jgi:hypothetical protein
MKDGKFKGLNLLVTVTKNWKRGIKFTFSLFQI